MGTHPNPNPNPNPDPTPNPDPNPNPNPNPNPDQEARAIWIVRQAAGAVEVGSRGRGDDSLGTAAAAADVKPGTVAAGTPSVEES